MSKFKLSATMQISVDEADKIIQKFFKIVPKVKSFLDSMGNLGKKRGYIRTSQPFGRIRWFPEFKELNKGKNDDIILGSIERASKNSPIQGTNADLIKLALVNVQNEIDENNWPVKILLAVYDEIQTECRKDLAMEWRSKLEEIMITSAKEVIKSIPVEVDCKIANHWIK